MKNTLYTITLCFLILRSSFLFAQFKKPVYTPEQPDFSFPVISGGSVFGIGKHKNTLLFGGNFKYVGPNTGYGLCLTNSGQLLQPGFPRIEGPVNCAIADGKGG